MDFSCETYGVENGRSDHYSVKNMRTNEDRTKVFFKTTPNIAVFISHPKKEGPFKIHTAWGTDHKVSGDENDAVKKGIELLTMWAEVLSN